MRWVEGRRSGWAPTRTTRRRRPAHPVGVEGFWIDRYQVTNRQFDAFVEATGYVTVAERPLDPADFPAPRRRTSCPARWSSRGRPGRWTCAT